MVLVEGESWGKTINYGASSERVRARVAVERPRFGGDNLPGTVLRENRQIHIPDLDNIDPGMAHWPVMAARAEGTRTVAATPLRHEARPIEVLIVYRGGLAPFTDGELALQQTFADQAVIAIENARLFNESQEALSRQTATSDILRVISRSPTDVQPVFDAIVQTAVRLLQCDRAFVMRCEGTRYVTVATAALDGSFDELGYAAPIDPAANFPSRAILEKQTLYYPDWSVIELPDREKHLRETYGINCSLFLPLLRDQECIGLLALVSKHSAMFGDSEIALAEILRRSGRDRDRECAAVQRDPGGAEPGRPPPPTSCASSASSPTDVQPVFDAIVQTAVRLLGCETSFILRCDGVHFGVWPGAGGKVCSALVHPRRTPVDPGANFPSRVIVDKKTLHLPDWSAIELPEIRAPHPGDAGLHSAAYLPLLREGECIGVLVVAGSRPCMFGDAEIALAKSFRRPGRDRDRECAAVQRDPAGAGAADRDGRHPQGDRELAVGHDAGVRGDRQQRQPAARRIFHCRVPIVR